MNRSVMNHNFSQVPSAEISRSSFDRSHGHKTTYDAGFLVPIFVDEALPGDTFTLNMSALARLATPIYPIMDNMFLETFFFAVPNRLVWDNWQKFCGEQIDPGDSTDYTIPTLTMAGVGFGEGGLADYFGMPTEVDNLEVSSLFHRAYNLIYNEWFRDENLQDSRVVDRDDGPDDENDYTLQRRGKRHDYFTSALPWPQKGDSIDLPLGTVAPVIPLTGVDPLFSSATMSNKKLLARTDSDTKWSGPSTGVDEPVGWGAVTGLEADLTSATAATINQLRQAFQVQKLLERDARGGSRYTEIIRAHFGVTSPDARLQRPEYLGGGSSMVNISPVAQTSETTATTPQANLSAIGTAQVNRHGFSKSFTEHCIIMGLVSVRADLTYQQGLNRMFSRQTRYDFFWPALQQIGEQSILNKEIYAQGTSVDEDVFGYQERNAEYRYKPSVISGKFRSNVTGTLDAWHLSQDFATLPTLNETFIQDRPPVDRVIAVTDEPHFIMDTFFQLRCARPMPMFGVPGLVDHF